MKAVIQENKPANILLLNKLYPYLNYKISKNRITIRIVNNSSTKKVDINEDVRSVL